MSINDYIFFGTLFFVGALYASYFALYANDSSINCILECLAKRRAEKRAHKLEMLMLSLPLEHYFVDRSDAARCRAEAQLEMKKIWMRIGSLEREIKTLNEKGKKK